MAEDKNNEDEEISIDFSKIKSFFKGKKKEEVKKPAEEIKPEKKEDSDEELNIDFSKIKNIMFIGKECILNSGKF